MDVNTVVLAGHLATDPELRVFSSGTRHLRLLVTVRSDRPRRRVDVVPVTWWDPPEPDVPLVRGHRVWVAGAVQRRFWSAAAPERSRIEIVAHHVEARIDEDIRVPLRSVEGSGGT